MSRCGTSRQRVVATCKRYIVATKVSLRVYGEYAVLKYMVYPFASVTVPVTRGKSFASWHGHERKVRRDLRLSQARFASVQRIGSDTLERISIRCGTFIGR